MGNWVIGFVNGRERFSLKTRPNLVRKNAIFEYTLPEKQKINLSIYDITGRRIKTLIDGIVKSGIHQVKWDLKLKNQRIGNGVYFAVLKGEKERKIQKIVILK